MKLLIFIPARQGSKGIKNKNIKKLKGKPLIDYTLEFSKKLAKFNKNYSIFLSTDSSKYLEYSKTKGIRFNYLSRYKIKNFISEICSRINLKFCNIIYKEYVVD